MKHNIHLIQRGKFVLEREKNFSKGIDIIIDFDYMGAAEFEYGALPESLKRIRDGISEYTYLDIPIQGKAITVFCKHSDKPEMKQILEDLALRKFSLHERSDFDTYIYPSGHKYDENRTDFWWDIDNDYMFWKSHTGFELEFKVLIQTKI